LGEARILRRDEVERIVGLKKSSIYAMMARGEFPQQVRIGRKAVGWPSTEIHEWVAQRIAARANGVAQ
jgi:prophage regulatory protein